MQKMRWIAPNLKSDEASSPDGIKWNPGKLSFDFPYFVALHTGYFL